MKLLQFLFRAGFSLFIAFIASFSSAVIFFNYSGYENYSRIASFWWRFPRWRLASSCSMPFPDFGHGSRKGKSPF